MNDFGLLTEANRQGLIMYADDQYVHRQSLRLTTIQELELDNNFTTYTNGK